MRSPVMEQVKEIEQLEKKKKVLEDISRIQEERIKRDAGTPMLILAGISGFLAMIVFARLFRR